MKLIPLSKTGKKNKGKYFAMVDDRDFELVSGYSWSISTSSKKSNIYAVTTIYNSTKTKYILMHRLILGLENKKIIVDHIDHNGLNNQRNNLRSCTYLQNSANTRSHKDGSSKYKGVYLLKQKHESKKGIITFYCRWQARIFVNGKMIYIGTFKDEKEAAMEYNKKAIELFKEYACLNNIN